MLYRHTDKSYYKAIENIRKEKIFQVVYVIKSVIVEY